MNFKNFEILFMQGYTIGFFSAFKPQLFKGVISNCQSKTLTNVSGSGSGSIGTGFTGNVSGGMSMKISTTHSHSTMFDIDNVTFKCNDECPFRDGDKVVLYAVREKGGYYGVITLKNFTRNFFYKTPLFNFVIGLVMWFFLLWGVAGFSVILWLENEPSLSISRLTLKVLYFLLTGDFGGAIAWGCIMSLAYFIIFIFCILPFLVGILLYILRARWKPCVKEIKNYPEF